MTRFHLLKLHIILVLILSLVMSSVCFVSADEVDDVTKLAEATKGTSRKIKNPKKYAGYDFKTNALRVSSSGMTGLEDIVLKAYIKEPNNTYKHIVTDKCGWAKSDSYAYENVLNAKSKFEYGKEYKYTIKAKKYTVEEKSLMEIVTEKVERGLATNPIEKADEKLSDLEKNSVKNYGKVLSFKTKVFKRKGKFKIPTKNVRLLAFISAYENAVYSQSKRGQKGYADCSSFVYECYKNIGMSFGEELGNTETELDWCEKNALKVKLSRAKLGDLIFYSDPDIDTFKKHYKHVTHVAMFKDNKTIIEMAGEKVNFRTRQVSEYDKDAIGVYRPIFDESDMKDKSKAKQKLKKLKKKKKKSQKKAKDPIIIIEETTKKKRKEETTRKPEKETETETSVEETT